MTYADALRQVAAAMESLPLGVVTIRLLDELVPECLESGLRHHVEMDLDQHILVICLCAEIIEDPETPYQKQIDSPAQVNAEKP